MARQPAKKTKKQKKPVKKAPSSARLRNVKAKIPDNSRMYRDIIETSLDLVWQCDAQGRYIYLNPAWEEALGYKLDEMLGRHFTDFQLPADAERDSRHFSHILQGGTIRGLETVHVAKDGHPVYLLFNAKQIIGRNGKPAGTRGTAQNITEQKFIEEKLLESESRFRNIVQSSPMGMHMYELMDDGRLIFIGANPAADRILGVDNSVFIGKTIEEAFPPLTQTEVPSRYRDIAANGTFWRTEQIDFEDKTIRGAFEVIAFQTSPNCMVAMFLDITERKRMDADLKMQKERLGWILEGTDAGTWEWNVQTGETLFNERWAQIIGYSLEEIAPVSIGTWSRFCHPDDLKLSEQALDRHFRGETDFYEQECRMRHKNGEWIWVLDRGKVISRTRDGKPLWMYGTHLDINIRKRAEEMLRESESRFRTIIDQSPISMAIVNPNGNIEYINRRAIDTFGYLPGDIPHMDQWWVMAYPEKVYREEVIADWMGRVQKAVAEGGEIPGNEYRVTCKDGTVKDINIFGTYTAGKVFVLFDDVTARRRAEEALRESEVRYRELFELNPAPMLIYERGSLKMLAVNGAWLEHYGYSHEEALKLVLTDLYPDEEKGPITELASRLKGHAYAGEWHHIRKDGNRITIIATSHDILYQGRTGRIAVITDITERKKAEEEVLRSREELKRINQELGERVTRQVEEMRKKDTLLLQQSRLAAIGETLHNIAHHWRQPLNAISLIIQHIHENYRQGALTDEFMQAKYNTAMNSIDFLSRTIDDFSGFFRKTEKPVRFNCLEYVHKTLDLVRESFNTDSIQVHIDAKGSLELDGYPNDYTHVLLLLLNNSREAMLERKVRDRAIWIHVSGEQDARIVLTLRDNAGGIPDTVIGKVFDPYFTTKPGGTGIGLYLARTIVREKLHGAISVRNTHDGCEFRIEIQR